MRHDQPKIGSKKDPNLYLMYYRKMIENWESKVKRTFEVSYSFMKLFSWSLHVLAPCCDVVISKLGQKDSNFYMMYIILKPGTVITLVQKFFSNGKFLNFETSILDVTSLFQNRNYQGRTYIWDTFFNFLKLQVLITDLAGYLTEELLSRIPITVGT